MTRNTRRPNPDARITRAIEAFRRARRARLSAERKLAQIVAAHPDLADPRPAVSIGTWSFTSKDKSGPARRGEPILVRCPADIYDLRSIAFFSEPMDSIIKRFEAETDKVRPAHRKARRQAGVLAAETDLYNGRRAEDRARETVFRNAPRSARVAATLAAFAMSYFRKECPPAPKEAGPKEWDYWQHRRLAAILVSVLPALRSIARETRSRRAA